MSNTRPTLANCGMTIAILSSLVLPVCGQGNQSGKRVTSEEVSGAIQAVEELANDFDSGVKKYHEHLQVALNTYGHGFDDPTYGKLSGFDGDIQSGDPTQTQQMRLATFASMLVTAGVHYDPDPLHDLEGIQKLLDRYAEVIDKAENVKRLSQTVAWGDREAISPHDFKDLTRRLHLAEARAEKARDLARAAFPVRLDPGITIDIAQAVDGPNLHGEVFGIRIGNELGNVNAQLKLTYIGRTARGDVFLLSFLKANAGKTRVDTSVSTRSILIHSEADDQHRYGYTVTAHDYSSYTVTSARIANVTDKVQDWAWKALLPQQTAMPAFSDLQQGLRKIDDSRENVNHAIDAFRQLSSRAVRQSDDALITEAKSKGNQAPLPEQDLKLFFPDARARLYAARALAVSDRRFVGEKDSVLAAITSARQQVQDTWALFKAFNGVPVYEHPEFQWTRIDSLTRQLMAAASKLESAAARFSDVLPPELDSTTPTVTAASLQFPPNVIVAQKDLGTADDGTRLIFEDIFRTVHPAVKGIGRVERTSQFVKVSPESGIHCVMREMAPEYITGESIRQIYQHAVEDEPRGFSTPDRKSISPMSGMPQSQGGVSTARERIGSPVGE